MPSPAEGKNYSLNHIEPCLPFALRPQAIVILSQVDFAVLDAVMCQAMSTLAGIRTVSWSVDHTEPLVPFLIELTYWVS